LIGQRENAGITRHENTGNGTVSARALGEEALFCVFKRKVVVLDILSNEPNSSEGRQIL